MADNQKDSTMTPDDILELAAKVERLDGPCRVCDELSLLAIGWKLERAQGLGERAIWIDANGVRTAHRQGDGWFRPTSSLDAAMKLIPGPDWEWSLEVEMGHLYFCEDERMVAIVKMGDPMRGWESTAATPALALCAASLRARATDMERER